MANGNDYREDYRAGPDYPWQNMRRQPFGSRISEETTPTFGQGYGPETDPYNMNLYRGRDPRTGKVQAMDWDFYDRTARNTGRLPGGGTTVQQRNYMTDAYGYDPTEGYGGGGGYGRPNPTLGGRAQSLREEEARASMYGYGPGGADTFQRQQWQAAMTGRYGGQDTLGGRAQAEAEAEGRFGRGLRGGEAVGYYDGRQTLGGRAQGLRETEAERDWQFKQATMAANPENYAVTAALRNQAPWQRAMQGGTPPPNSGVQNRAAMTPLPGSGVGSVPTARTMNLAGYDTMKPSERGVFGSALRAGGTTTQDFEQEQEQYRPQRNRYAMGAFR